ncbi:YMGG-like glycine zipper-containing protein [Pseudogemmobacter sonorensis]|uniref:YMGG-like glycine zipper-containing protein n=1 Tax=Pseudogemmobacter sonorensis TaxID=2989681 RepID=UPI0036CB2DD0
MKPVLVLFAAAALGLSACTQTEQNAAIGALGGAAVGAAVSSDSDRTKGAMLGAVVGTVAGTMVGQTNTRGQCYYADGRGGTYIASC